MSPEGRSFVSVAPMPFARSATIQIVNRSKSRISHLFYDVDVELRKTPPRDSLYFHARWHRDPATKLANDFEVLPRVVGRGRYVGAMIEVQSNPVYRDSWWGEGEVHMFIDDDRDRPTIAGTGAEDYFGTAYGFGLFQSRYSGCTVVEGALFGCFRLHLPDPVYFHKGIRVTLQQIGGNSRDKVIAMQRDNVPLIPVSIDDDESQKQLFSDHRTVTLGAEHFPDSWTNFYRSDDVAAIAYFYLDRPGN